MGGWICNGLPPVAALVQNGATVQADQLSINGSLYGGAPITYTVVNSRALIPVDTEAGSGAPPQSVAATAFQVASRAAALFKNTATSTAGAATLNTVSGLIQTESLSTAIGSTYTMTVTNSLVSTANTPPSPAPQVSMESFSNTAGAVQINSITNGTGSFVVVVQNIGTAAFNGTFLIPFHI